MKYLSVRPWTRIVVFVFLLCSLILTIAPTHAIRYPPVLAFYYTDYSTGNWSYEWMSDRPTPLYSSGDGDTMYRHIEQANTAGIDGFICAWMGEDHTTDGRCRSMQERINNKSDYGMRIAYMPVLSRESDNELLDFDQLAHAVTTLRDEVMYQPGYLHLQNRPAVFFLNPKYFGEPDDWARLRNQIDLYREQFWVATTTIPALEADLFNYLNVFDAVSFYDITHYDTPYTAMGTYAQNLQQFNAAHQSQKPFFATVSPGFNDTRTNPQGHIRDRADGNYYLGAWDAAMQHNPDVLLINSFNNFYQGNHIEPSENYGLTYLNLTQQKAAQFHATAPASTVAADYFSPTGHYLKGAFRTYWQNNGSVERFGYPLTEEYIRDSDGRVVQYFERARFELNVVNGQAIVELGALGEEFLDRHDQNYRQGHNVRGAFKSYWDATGGFLGPAITGEMYVMFPDGIARWVQYFQRGRLELQPSGSVTLGLIGLALAPCDLLAPLPPGAAPERPLQDVEESPCESPYPEEVNSDTDYPVNQPAAAGVPTEEQTEPLARGRVYPAVVQPGTVQGFEAWDYMPGEEVSLWFNLPDGSTHDIAYNAVADETGYVLVGIQTRRIDPLGAWSLVGKGNTSGRTVVAPFELQW